MQNNSEDIKLTQFSRGAGCGCKIAPQVLREILGAGAGTVSDPRLLVGNADNDDAAVYALGNGEALIATTDFFMPIVDGAYDFGRVAAANAISDVYAMGGRPLLALAVLGWPVDKLPAALAGQVLDGAKAVCAEAGIPLAGGHSIDSPEPLFGLSVNGLVHEQQLKRNTTAREGDLIFMSKPIGSGILATAHKRGQLEPQHLQPLLSQLTKLNSLGAELGKLRSVSAMTDITGFGLLGHLTEMATGSRLSAEINFNAIPRLPGVEQYIAAGVTPDATYRNWNAYSPTTEIGTGVDPMASFMLLPDPQTNGGLLFAVDPADAEDVAVVLRQHGYGDFARPIGRFTAPGAKLVTVLV